MQDLWQSLLSNLVNNLAERIHKIECKNEHDNKKDKTCGIKYKDCECGIECMEVKYDLIEQKCLCYNKNYEKNV